MWTLGAMLLRRWAPLSHCSSRAEPTLTSWVGLRNLSSKTSNFSLCHCYSLPQGKGIKLLAKRQHRLFGTKEYLWTPVCRHMHLPPSRYTRRWRIDAHYSGTFCVPISRGWKLGRARQVAHSYFKQVSSHRPYLLYNLDINMKVIRTLKPET